MLGTRIPKRMAKEKGSTRVQYYDSTVQFISTKFIPDPIFGCLRVCPALTFSLLNLTLRDKRPPAKSPFLRHNGVFTQKTPGACSNMALECVYLIKWWLDKKPARNLKCPTMGVRRWGQALALYWSMTPSRCLFRGNYYGWDKKWKVCINHRTQNFPPLCQRETAMG